MGIRASRLPPVGAWPARLLVVIWVMTQTSALARQEKARKWMRFGANEYYISPWSGDPMNLREELRDFAGARQECRAWGGDLASIPVSMLLKFLVNNMLPKPVACNEEYGFWIDLRYTGGAWAWGDGSAFTLWAGQQWYRAAPQGLELGRRVYLSGCHDYTWVVRDQDRLSRYICQKASTEHSESTLWNSALKEENTVEFVEKRQKKEEDKATTQSSTSPGQAGDQGLAGNGGKTTAKPMDIEEILAQLEAKENTQVNMSASPAPGLRGQDKGQVSSELEPASGSSAGILAMAIIVPAVILVIMLIITIVFRAKVIKVCRAPPTETEVQDVDDMDIDPTLDPTPMMSATGGFMDFAILGQRSDDLESMA